MQIWTAKCNFNEELNFEIDNYSFFSSYEIVVGCADCEIEYGSISDVVGEVVEFEAHI